MNWKHLTLEEALDGILVASKDRPQLIFKHSTRCSISTMAKDRLERKWNSESIDPWYLDLLNYRGISNMIETRFGIRHESPQVLLFENGDLIYHASHNSISAQNIVQALS
jgi:bacillithiol system protein YtxJ